MACRPRCSSRKAPPASPARFSVYGRSPARTYRCKNQDSVTISGTGCAHGLLPAGAAGAQRSILAVPAALRAVAGTRPPSHARTGRAGPPVETATDSSPPLTITPRQRPKFSGHSAPARDRHINAICIRPEPQFAELTNRNRAARPLSEHRHRCLEPRRGTKVVTDDKLQLLMALTHRCERLTNHKKPPRNPQARIDAPVCAPARGNR